MAEELHNERDMKFLMPLALCVSCADVASDASKPAGDGKADGAARTESEPNDLFEQADVLAKPGTIRAKLAASDDVDVFRIRASGRLNLELDVPPGADFDLTLWSGDEHVIDASDTGVIGEPETLSVELGPEPASYYIEVVPYVDNVSAETYTLSAEW